MNLSLWLALRCSQEDKRRRQTKEEEEESGASHGWGRWEPVAACHLSGHGAGKNTLNCLALPWHEDRTKCRGGRRRRRSPRSFVKPLGHSTPTPHSPLLLLLLHRGSTPSPSYKEEEEEEEEDLSGLPPIPRRLPTWWNSLTANGAGEGCPLDWMVLPLGRGKTTTTTTAAMTTAAAATTATTATTTVVVIVVVVAAAAAASQPAVTTTTTTATTRKGEKGRESGAMLDPTPPNSSHTWVCFQLWKSPLWHCSLCSLPPLPQLWTPCAWRTLGEWKCELGTEQRRRDSALSLSLSLSFPLVLSVSTSSPSGISFHTSNLHPQLSLPHSHVWWHVDLWLAILRYSPFPLWNVLTPLWNVHPTCFMTPTSCPHWHTSELTHFCMRCST